MGAQASTIFLPNRTVFAIIQNTFNFTFWNGTALEAWTDTSFANYAQGTTSPSSSCPFYNLSAPAALPSGFYKISFFDESASTPTITSLQNGPIAMQGDLYWNGTNFEEVSITNINAEVDTALADASVTANVMNTIITNLDATLSSRSTFDPTLSGVTLTSAQTGVTIDTVSNFGASATAQINTEVLDVLNTDQFAESSVVPSATSSLISKISWLNTLARNKIEQTSTKQTLYDDAGTGTIGAATVSDDGTTATRGEWS